MTAKKQNPEKQSPLRKQTANYIYILAVSLLIAGIYVLLSREGLNNLDGIINVLFGITLFFTAQQLQHGSIRSAYIGSLAVIILIFYGLVKDTRLILLSLIMPGISYGIIYSLWKFGELR